jgi:hypothetical protein
VSERLDRIGYRLVKTAEDYLTTGREEIRDRFLRLVAEAGEIRRAEHQEHYRALLAALENDSDTLRRFARKVVRGSRDD